MSKVVVSRSQLLTLWFFMGLLVFNMAVAAEDWKVWSYLANGPVLLLLLLASLNTRDPRHPATQDPEEQATWLPPKSNDARPGSN